MFLGVSMRALEFSSFCLMTRRVAGSWESCHVGQKHYLPIFLRFCHLKYFSSISLFFMSSSSDVFSNDLIFGEAFCLFVFPYLLDTGLSVLNCLHFLFLMA